MLMTPSSRAFVPFLLILTLAVLVISAHGQSFSVLHDFASTPDGQLPVAALLDRNGTLFGTTQESGSFNVEGAAGTVFTVDIGSGQESVLYTFGGGFHGPDGALPSSSLETDAKGNLYSTTLGGGSNDAVCGEGGCGIIFEMSPDGTETILYTFTGGADGAGPNGIIFDSAGNLYGTALGGVYQNCNGGGCGVVFKLAPSGNLTVLYSFTGGSDGAGPAAGSLTIDKAGNLYGATAYGGNLSACVVGSRIGCGVVFKIDPNGNESVLHTFTGGADGAQPNGSLLLDPKGNLYGTTFSGGPRTCRGLPDSYPGCGVVFELTASGTLKVLHGFRGAAYGDGASPDAGLMWDGVANFFGTTYRGGTYNDGSVFQLNRDGITLLHSFNQKVDGWLPQAGVIRDAQGNLYGTTAGNNYNCPFGSGQGYCGTVFKVVAPPQITRFTPASGSVGTTVSISGVSLSQTTEVTFNGVQSGFTMNSDKLVTATVPTGATTGKIAITSPGGTATSSTSFTVTQ